MQEGYRTQQATKLKKPQSLSYAMIDSPKPITNGTAAWILKKFHGWSDP